MLASIVRKTHSDHSMAGLNSLFSNQKRVLKPLNSVATSLSLPLFHSFLYAGRLGGNVHMHDAAEVNHSNTEYRNQKMVYCKTTDESEW
jgi:hypothetical protein